jgi:cyclopropane-fatty-acyl-phospholipid synthase
MKNAEIYALEFLNAAGIKVNGDNPWDIQVYNQKFYAYVLKYGSLGLGESYMNQWWDCKHLDQFFDRLMTVNREESPSKLLRLKEKFQTLTNLQTKIRSLNVGQTHYDLGNTLFQYMLDNRMNYTCGYWHQAQNLEEAQRNKLELTCQKMLLKPGMRLLDIGCGFGALAKYAAEHYQVNVVGITISKEQCAYAQQNCTNLPVEIRFQDYRDLHEKFDRIVSLGMFEHVGPRNYHTYMKTVHTCLEDEGLFLLHTIGNNVSHLLGDEWLNQYIFPNGVLPSIAQIGKAAEGLWVMEDWHNFGADYDKTLMAWYANFNQHWPQLQSQYDQRFYRMWCYYLLSCAGMFRARHTQLWQIVFSKKGIPNGYQAPRFV